VLFVMLFQWLNGNPTLAFSANYLLAQVLGGGLLLGAVFMATDYVTSPITRGGQWVYAILLGFLTALFRVFGSSAEGVSYAIIIGNTLVPLIERVTMPRAFGSSRKGGAVK
jgi:electron transport complex protein RnfD/electron transport complex protein RnfC